MTRRRYGRTTGSSEASETASSKARLRETSNPAASSLRGDNARLLESGWTWDQRNPHVAATFEPDSRIDYVFVGPPGGDGLGQVLDVGLFGMKAP